MKICSNCYKNDEECKCTLESIIDNTGSGSTAQFGHDSFEYEVVKMDKRIILKLKIWNDVIYLDYENVKFLNDITSRYIDIKDKVHARMMKDWECDSCGKKTNNMQEYCVCNCEAYEK